MMISRSVEISIAGGGDEMVRGSFPEYFFYIIYYLLRYKNLHAALAMA